MTLDAVTMFLCVLTSVAHHRNGDRSKGVEGIAGEKISLTDHERRALAPSGELDMCPKSQRSRSVGNVPQALFASCTVNRRHGPTLAHPQSLPT